MKSFRSDADNQRALVVGPLSSLREAPPWQGVLAHLSALENELVASFQEALSDERAALLATIVRLVYQGGSIVELDDLLYEQGFLDILPLPDRYSEAVDIGSPVSLLAARIQRCSADYYRRAAITRLNAARKVTEISLRQYRLQRKMAELDHARHTFAWANRLVSAIRAANMRVVLACLNTADNENRACKQAIAEVLGVKLMGLRSVARRRAIFALCGLDEEAQLTWEHFYSVIQDPHMTRVRKGARKMRDTGAKTMPDNRLGAGADQFERAW